MDAIENKLFRHTQLPYLCKIVRVFVQIKNYKQKVNQGIYFATKISTITRETFKNLFVVFFVVIRALCSVKLCYNVWTSR